MVTAPARSPRLLLIATVVLVVAGLILLRVPGTPSAPTAPAAPRTTTPPSPAATWGGLASQTGSPGHATVPSTSATASKRSPGASALPPRGEGTAGDGAIQTSLEEAWPVDLAAGDEHRLVAAGRALLRADATGIGRSRWPQLFGTPAAIAPAFAAARFRIQAAVSRSDGSPDRAVVHLVWAGTDRGGTYTDRRLADWHFVRTSTKGATTWVPQPRI
ncbi:hypothetical protein [Streptomyces sp. NPDC002516]